MPKFCMGVAALGRMLRPKPPIQYKIRQHYLNVCVLQIVGPENGRSDG